MARAATLGLGTVASPGVRRMTVRSRRSNTLGNLAIRLAWDRHPPCPRFEVAPEDGWAAVVGPLGAPAVLVAAGDSGEWGPRGAAAPATLLDLIPGTVFTAGDNAYPSGSAKDYARCYRPFWGRHRKRTRPAL